MKKILLCLLCLLPVVFLQAQKSITDDSQATERTAKLKQILNLDTDQEAAVLKIQERKSTQVAELRELKQNDPSKYYKKLQNIYEGNEIAVQRLLRKEQLKAYHANRHTLRLQKSQLVKKMKASNASQLDIDEAVRRLEYDFSY